MGSSDDWELEDAESYADATIVSTSLGIDQKCCKIFERNAKRPLCDDEFSYAGNDVIRVASVGEPAPGGALVALTPAPIEAAPPLPPA